MYIYIWLKLFWLETGNKVAIVSARSCLSRQPLKTFWTLMSDSCDLSAAVSSKKAKIDYLGEDIEMLNNNNNTVAPDSQPAWLAGFEDRVALKTSTLMESRLANIETTATKTSKDVAALQAQVSHQMAAQQEMRLQITGMNETFLIAQTKNEEDNASDRSRSTAAPAGNPYTRDATQAVDKAVIIVGGWPENTAAPIMVANLSEVLAAYNSEHGKHWTFEEARCMGQRGKVVQAKILGDLTRTALQKGYDLTGWIRSHKPDIMAVGFKGESNKLWAVMNQPVEVRNVSRAVNRAVHVLHKLREQAGIPELVQEQGHALKLVEGRYKGKTIGATISGEWVAIVNPSTLAIVFDFPKIRASILGATENQVSAMLAAITPTGGG